MADIILFPRREKIEDEAVDLLSAVDVAIRDLREISARWGALSGYERAEISQSASLSATPTTRRARWSSAASVPSISSFLFSGPVMWLTP